MRQRKIFFHLLKIVLEVIFIILFAVGPALAQDEDKGEGKDGGKNKMRGRLEQLFIWRVSDRLQLTPDEEAKFTEAYKKLSEDRTEQSHKMDDILTKLADNKADKKAKTKLLGEYEEANKKYIQLQQTEMTKMKHIFDTDKLVDYVLLKREMFHKFRDALTTSKGTAVADSPDKPKLKEPEVIQEK